MSSVAVISGASAVAEIASAYGHWGGGGFLGTMPELQYLYATWGSKLPYRKAAALLKDLLPVSLEGVSHATVRRHTLAVGARIDQRITEPDEYDWPESRQKRYLLRTSSPLPLMEPTSAPTELRVWESIMSLRVE
jgi:hypothetical protein